MNSKERIAAILRGEVPDRIGTFDSYWEETLERWRQEGMPENTKPEEYFDHDFRLFSFEQRFGFEEKVLEETDAYTVVYTSDGNTQKVPKTKDDFIRTVDLHGVPIDYEFKTRADWERYKHLYKPGRWRLTSQPLFSGRFYYTYSSIDELKRQYEKARGEGKFVAFAAREPFENTRAKFGTEGILVSMASDPELMTEIYQADVDVTLGMFDLMSEEGLEFDGFWCWGDICYNKGMMFSPRSYREILMPAHKRLFQPFKSAGKPIIYHTDGNLDEALPLLIESGIDAIQPIEVKAGNDLIRLKERYGDKVTLVGGIDTRAMAHKLEIRRELEEKLPIAMKNGRYIYHSDHSVPPNVCLEDYRLILDLVRRLGQYPSR